MSKFNLNKPSKKMQDVSFKSFDDFFDYLPEDELKMVEILRLTIFECIPNIQEKLSFNVPFYQVNKSICFLWPSSVLWGKKKSYVGVRLGFTKGYLMVDEIGYLDKGNRKQVYYKDFISINDIKLDILKEYLFQAAILDHQFKK